MLQHFATFCDIPTSPPGTAAQGLLAHAPGVDLDTRIVATHIAGRITELETATARAVGLVVVDSPDDLPAAVEGVRTFAASTAYSAVAG